MRAADALDLWQWQMPVPQGNNLSSIACGNGVYVAVGDYASILTSTHGMRWAFPQISKLLGS